MLVYCKLDSREHVSVKFESEFVIFIQENAFENVVCQNGSHCVQGEIGQWRACGKDCFLYGDPEGLRNLDSYKGIQFIE